MQLNRIALAAAMLLPAGLLYAQFDFNAGSHNVQVHSFGSQSFAYSDHNNYLSMHTSDGTFSMTDGGINIGTQLTDKLHVGAQLYDRNVGKLGNWRPDPDYYFADYRFKDWFGIRGGKVKTSMGLYTDTQDLTFLYTWALLPQSVYPVDSRGDNIAHSGGDLYGNVELKKAGSLNYTFYGGYRANDSGSGLLYSQRTSASTQTPQGVRFVLSSAKLIDYFAGPTYGADLRWTTPIKGLLAGASFANVDVTGHGTWRATGFPYLNVTTVDKIYAFYTQYNRGGFTFAAEYRREPRDSLLTTAAGGFSLNNRNSRQGFVSAAYRVSKWLEIGSYHSRIVLNWQANHGDPFNHIFDTAITTRFDLKSYLDLKFEGHFIDGNLCNSGMSRGFFVAEDTGGFEPHMKMLVIRLEYHM